MNDDRTNIHDGHDHGDFEMPNDELDALLRDWHEANTLRARSRRAEVLRVVRAEADSIEDDLMIEGDAATRSPAERGRVGVGAGELGAPRADRTERDSRRFSHPPASSLKGGGDHGQNVRATHAHVRATHTHGRDARATHAARATRPFVFARRYTALAASLMVLVAIGALLIPHPKSSAYADLVEIMVPDGGKLEAMDELGRVIGPCPLKHTDVDVRVAGRFTRVTVTQQYHNPYDSKIEAVYTFPLSHRAAVDRMTMTIGDRVVIGEVKERQQARQIYEAARQQGHVASLLEQERPNIFTQSVANIEPGAQVDIEISYVETLESADGVYTFDFPMVVGPRYIPGSPNSSGVLLPAELVEREGAVLLGPGQFTIDGDAEDIDTEIHGTLQAGKLKTLLHAAHAIEFPGEPWWGIVPEAPPAERGVILGHPVTPPVIAVRKDDGVTIVELEAGSRDGMKTDYMVTVGRSDKKIALVRVREVTENTCVGEVIEFLGDATEVRVGDMGYVEWPAGDDAPGADAEEPEDDDRFIILYDEQGNEVGRIDKSTIIPQIPQQLPPLPQVPMPFILPGPQGQPLTVIPNQPLPVLNMPAIWSPFTVTYCDGTSESGEIFVDGTGHLNGRWFFTDPKLIEGVGTGYAPNTDQVPDASRITPMPVRPPTRAGHDIDVTVHIDTGGPGIEWIRSDLHEIDGDEQILRADAPQREANLRLANAGEIPNRDFVLSWRLEDDTIEESTFAHFGEYGEWSGGFFTLVLAPPTKVEDAQVRARELIFVLDTSGSMSGFPIDKGKEVMSKAIDAMRAGDTFNVITFSGDTRILWEHPRPNTEANRAEAQQFLASHSGSGGTEMMKAIDAALRPQNVVEPDREGAHDDVIDAAELADLPADGRVAKLRVRGDRFTQLFTPNDFVNSWDGLRYGENGIMSIRGPFDFQRLGDETEWMLTGRWVTDDGQAWFEVDGVAAVDSQRDAAADAPPMRIVMFLTDGYVGNDTQIVQAVQEHAKTTRVFAFGIGDSVNRYLLDSMAQAGRGEAEFVLIDSDADVAVERFASRISAPVLTDIELTFSDGLEVTDTIPSADFVPDLFDQRPLIIHGRYTKPGEGTLRITGMTAAGRYERELPINLPAAGEGDQADVLGKLWARANIAEMTRIEETPDMRTKIVALGEAFQIMTNHTSFVAVDHSRVTVGGQPMLVPVPIELPSRVSWEGNFGGLDADKVVDGAVAQLGFVGAVRADQVVQFDAQHVQALAESRVVLAEAEEMLGDGQWAKARDRFSMVLGVQPDHQEAIEGREKVVEQLRSAKRATERANALADVAAALAKGEAHLQAAEWQAAKQAFQEALRAVSGNQRAIEGIAEANVMLNHDPPLDPLLMEQSREREVTRVEFEAAMDRARDLMSRGDYQQAELTAADAQVRLSRRKDTVSEKQHEAMGADADELLKQIEESRQVAVLEQVSASESQARTRIAGQERQERAARGRLINKNFRRVRELQQNLRYDEANEVIDEILFIDPLNPAALVLRDSIRTAQTYAAYSIPPRTKERNIPQLSLDVQKSMVPPGGVPQAAWYDGHVEAPGEATGYGLMYHLAPNTGTPATTDYFSTLGFDWSASSHYILTTEGIRQQVPVLGDVPVIGPAFRNGPGAQPGLLNINGASVELIAGISPDLLSRNAPQDVKVRVDALQQVDRRLATLFAQTPADISFTTTADEFPVREMRERLSELAAANSNLPSGGGGGGGFAGGGGGGGGRQVQVSGAAGGESTKNPFTGVATIPDELTLGSGDEQSDSGGSSVSGGDGQTIQFPWQRDERSPEESALVGRFRVVPIVRLQCAAILAPSETRAAIRAAIEEIDPDGVIQFATPRFPQLFAATFPLVVKADVLPELARRFSQQTDTPYAGQDEASAIEWLNANLEAVFPDAETVADKSAPAGGAEDDVPDVSVKALDDEGIAKLLEELLAKREFELPGARVTPPLRVDKPEMPPIEFSENVLRSPDGYRYYKEDNVIHVVTPQEYDEWAAAKDLEALLNEPLPDDPIDRLAAQLVRMKALQVQIDETRAPMMGEAATAETEIDAAGQEALAEARRTKAHAESPVTKLYGANLPPAFAEQVLVLIGQLAERGHGDAAAYFAAGAADVWPDDPLVIAMRDALRNESLDDDSRATTVRTIASKARQIIVGRIVEVQRQTRIAAVLDPRLAGGATGSAGVPPAEAETPKRRNAETPKLADQSTGQHIDTSTNQLVDKSRSEPSPLTPLPKGEGKKSEPSPLAPLPGREGELIVSVLLESLDAEVLEAIAGAGLVIEDGDETRRFVVGRIARENLDDLAMVRPVRKIEPVE